MPYNNINMSGHLSVNSLVWYTTQDALAVIHIMSTRIKYKGEVVFEIILCSVCL